MANAIDNARFNAFKNAFSRLAEGQGVNEDARVTVNGSNQYELKTVKHSWWDAVVRFFTRNISPSEADNALGDISQRFYQSVKSIFANGDIPPTVQAQLEKHVSADGVMRPLTARRIRCVTKAIEDLKRSVDDFNAHQPMSPEKVKALAENNVINEVQVRQAEIDKQVVQGLKEVKEIVAVAKDQVQMLGKEGFRVVPTSKNGNTLINSLLPQVNSEFDQKNEFQPNEEQGVIQHLREQLFDKFTNTTNYGRPCSYTPYRQQDGQWELIENSEKGNYGDLNWEKSQDYSTQDEVAAKKRVANRSFRQLALAANAYRRPVVLISMYDESLKNGSPLKTPRKIVFNHALNGEPLRGEPICIYRDQAGDYSRLAYTEEGRKSEEYKKLTEQPKGYEELQIPSGKTYHDEDGQTIVDRDEIKRRWQQEQQEIKEDLARAGLKLEIEHEEEQQPKVEEINQPSEEELKLAKLLDDYNAQKLHFREKLKTACRKYLRENKLFDEDSPKPEDKIYRDLFLKYYNNLRDFDAYNRFHDFNAPPSLNDAGVLQEAVDQFIGVKDFDAKINEMMDDVKKLPESGEYQALTQKVVDRLHEKFKEVPPESIKKLAAGSVAYNELASNAVLDVVLLDEQSYEYEGRIGDTVAKLVELLTPDVEEEVRRIADEKRRQEEVKANELKLKEEQKLKAELEKQQRLEAQNRLKDELTASLTRQCQEQAQKLFEGFCRELMRKDGIEDPFEMPQMPEGVKRAAERYRTQQLALHQDEILKAAQEGRKISDFKLSDVVLRECLNGSLDGCKTAVSFTILKQLEGKLPKEVKDRIQLYRTMQLKGYMDAVSDSTGTNRQLLGFWPVGKQQEKMQVNADVEDQVTLFTQRSDDYQQRLIDYAIHHKGSLDGAPMPMDEKAVKWRQDECKALLTGLTQLRNYVFETTKYKPGVFKKKVPNEAANSFLAERVRPRLAQMVMAIVADGKPASEVFSDLVGQLFSPGEENLDKYVQDRQKFWNAIDLLRQNT